MDYLCAPVPPAHCFFVAPQMRISYSAPSLDTLPPKAGKSSVLSVFYARTLKGRLCIAKFG
ncbi:unnamed protein product [Meloidogyne enterolobii]|uniref:Uncharacterized protein n=1 Tax=Meloidogyne enterolobii TaxID=390850 RepID=A0ACB0ZBP6_MELEN